MSTLTEIIGYVATAVTLWSFTQNDQLKLRFVNLTGAGIWIGYGALIGSMPVILTNGLIIVFHIRWLYFNWYK